MIPVWEKEVIEKAMERNKNSCFIILRLFIVQKEQKGPRRVSRAN
jgi:hypothetical protein